MRRPASQTSSDVEPVRESPQMKAPRGQGRRLSARFQRRRVARQRWPKLAVNLPDGNFPELLVDAGEFGDVFFGGDVGVFATELRARPGATKTVLLPRMRPTLWFSQ